MYSFFFNHFQFKVFYGFSETHVSLPISHIAVHRRAVQSVVVEEVLSLSPDEIEINTEHNDDDSTLS